MALVPFVIKVLRWLDHLWRIIATGYFFAFLFVGGFVLALTVFPLLRLYPGSVFRKNARARKLVHHIFQFYIWHMQKLGLMTLEIHGIENLQMAGGKLVIANHPSLLDVVLLISLIPDADCIVKGSLRRSLVGGVIRATGYIYNSGPADAAQAQTSQDPDHESGTIETLLASCRESMNANCPLIVFPEGTRSTPGQPLVFQRGAANIAVRCGADILPIVISCDPPTLLKGESWYRIPPRRPRFSVDIRKPLSVSSIIDKDAPPSLAVRQLNRYLLTYYQQRPQH